MDTNELTYKTEISSQSWKTKLWLPKWIVDQDEQNQEFGKKSNAWFHMCSSLETLNSLKNTSYNLLNMSLHGKLEFTFNKMFIDF